jgi:hypothetical protein
MSNGSQSGSQQQPVAYQHWLDDAANMGLMLYRMRNDSKRERMVGPPRVQNNAPPSPAPPQTPASSPIPMATRRQHPVDHPHRHRAYETPSPMRLREVTPRTSRALQTPTVATQSTDTSSVAQPPAFYLPLGQHHE